MKKLNLAQIIETAKFTITKHSPELLTGIGIAGMVTTTVLAVRATPKALDLLEQEKARINRELIKQAADNDEDVCELVDKLKFIDTVKVTWKCYIPSVILGTTSVVCLIGASSVNLKRNAALATAYKLSETALTEYRDKVVETIGEKKEQLIRDKVAEEKIKSDPVSQKEVIILGNGNTLCYDVISGRYFKSDMEHIKRAENLINKQMLNEMYVSLNDFYDSIGLSYTRMGDQLGWSSDDGLLEISFSSQLADDGQPCLVIDYNVAPKYGFSSFV